MSRVIIMRSSEWANGKIGSALQAFQEQQQNAERKEWIRKTELQLAAAKLNVFFIDEATREFDKRCINQSKGVTK